MSNQVTTLTIEEFDALFENFDLDAYLRQVEAADKLKILRRERPWVYDIIRVLWPRRAALHMNVLERELWAIRNPTLPMPKEFRKTIQSALNRYSSQSHIFFEQERTPEDDLFYSPEGKGSGTWAVRHDRAISWLKRKKLPAV
jgi:hypothetical protein